MFQKLLSHSELKRMSLPSRFGFESIYDTFSNYCERHRHLFVEENNSQQIAAIAIDSFFDFLSISYSFQLSLLDTIPQDGPFVLVSNHPIGGLDALLMYKIISQKRPDFKVMEQSLFHNNSVFDEIFFSHYPFGDAQNVTIQKSSITHMYKHLREGGCLGVFPAVEGKHFSFARGKQIDSQWQTAIIGSIRQSQVPIIPFFVKSSPLGMNEIVKKMHPLFRYTQFSIPWAYKNRPKPIECYIGTPISVKEQREFTKDFALARYLRAVTYMLGHSAIEVKDFFSTKKIVDVQAVIEPVDVHFLEIEISSIRKDSKLFSIKNFDVFCTSAVRIPFVMREIGRLREITFRSVGEGTNKSMDIDEYDLYYEHLFIWDSSAKKIVGAYRIGKGKDILMQYGKKGFYIHSLFKIQNSVIPTLSQSLELGRSFIVPEYQKHHYSLFLLWRGIVYFLLKNEEYRYLIGPVSISNSFTKLSKSLIVSCISSHHFHHALAKQIKPRKNFKIPKHIIEDIHDMIEYIDVKKLDKHIETIEHNQKIPVLLKKYISLNAKIASFNIDPKFNDCLDGLIILDIFDIPYENISSIAKDVNDTHILKRFYTAT